MTYRTRLLVCVLALGFPTALSACASSHSTHRSLEVEAFIASVTLAEDCLSGGAGAPEDCAEDSACAAICTPTAVQLALEAGEGDADVPFEVIAVRIRAMDGALLDELDPREALLFREAGYVAWDERVAPGASLQVRYETSAPDWTSIGDGDPWATYGMQFRVEVVVRVDGAERTLEFAPATREPEIVT